MSRCGSSTNHVGTGAPPVLVERKLDKLFALESNLAELRSARTGGGARPHVVRGG